MIAPTCICSHSEDQHDDRLGYCNAKDCSCVAYRNEDDDFADDEIEELDFDTDTED